nr:hypothetical protein [Microvirga rosea]
MANPGRARCLINGTGNGDIGHSEAAVISKDDLMRIGACTLVSEQNVGEFRINFGEVAVIIGKVFAGGMHLSLAGGKNAIRFLKHIGSKAIAKHDGRWLPVSACGG